MRNSFGGITLGEQCVTEQLVATIDIGIQFKCPFERRYGSCVIVLFDEHLAEIEERQGEFRVKINSLLKLGDCGIQLAALVRFDSGMQMLKSWGRSRLEGQNNGQPHANHDFSGSRTSRNWLVFTASRI